MRLCGDETERDTLSSYQPVSDQLQLMDTVHIHSSTESWRTSTLLCSREVAYIDRIDRITGHNRITVMMSH